MLVAEELQALVPVASVAIRPNMPRIPDVLLLPVAALGSGCCQRVAGTPNIFGYRYGWQRDSSDVHPCLAKYEQWNELK